MIDFCTCILYEPSVYAVIQLIAFSGIFHAFLSHLQIISYFSLLAFRRRASFGPPTMIFHCSLKKFQLKNRWNIAFLNLIESLQITFLHDISSKLLSFKKKIPTEMRVTRKLQKFLVLPRESQDMSIPKVMALMMTT